MENGITLVALVVTIVVLLILAAVSLNLILGENGIITKAKEAKQQTEIGQERESIELAIIAVQIDNNGFGELNKGKLQEELNKQFKGEEVEVIKANNGFVIKLKDRQKNYRVDQDGKIMEIGEGSDIYVVLYTDGTLTFANTNKKDSNKSIRADFGNIKWDFYTNYVDDSNNRIVTTPWFEYRDDIIAVEILDEIVPVDTSNWFSMCSKIQKMNLNNMNTSKVVTMYAMFYQCETLTNLEISNFNTSNVIDMQSMFNQCKSLTNLDVSKFDTSKVTNMQSMFKKCGKLTSLDLSGFNTSKVTDMKNMFIQCEKLTSLDVSNFDTSNVITMEHMFNLCSNITNLDVSRFNTSKVVTMYGMFYRCNSLTNLDVSNFNTSKVTNMQSMFNGCGGLVNLDLTSFNTRNVTNMQSMFKNCPKLIKINIGPDWVTSSNNSNMFSNCGVDHVG